MWFLKCSIHSTSKHEAKKTSHPAMQYTVHTVYRENCILYYFYYILSTLYPSRKIPWNFSSTTMKKQNVEYFT